MPFFEKSSYLTAEKSGVTSPLHLLNLVSVDLKFSYGKKITLKDFSTHYEKDFKIASWLGRKVLAIPRVAFIAFGMIVKVAVFILICLPQVLFGKTDFAKWTLYSLARDAQSALGSLASLVHDRWGMYQMEQASFHQECYAHSYGYSNDRSALVQSFIDKEFCPIGLGKQDIGLEKQEIDKIFALSGKDFAVIFPPMALLLLKTKDIENNEHIKNLDWNILDYDKMNINDFAACFALLYKRMEALTDDNFKLIYNKFTQTKAFQNHNLLKNGFYTNIPAKYIHYIENIDLLPQQYLEVWFNDPVTGPKGFATLSVDTVKRIIKTGKLSPEILLAVVSEKQMEDAEVKTYMEKIKKSSPKPKPITKEQEWQDALKTLEITPEKGAYRLNELSPVEKKEIEKIYKKLALRYHPDKIGKLSEADQGKAKHKMSDINTAHDLLTET